MYENSVQGRYGLCIHLIKFHEVTVFYSIILPSMSLNFHSAQSLKAKYEPHYESYIISQFLFFTINAMLSRSEKSIYEALQMFSKYCETGRVRCSITIRMHA